MTVKTLSNLASRESSDALVLPFFEGKKPAFSSKEVESLFQTSLRAGDFEGKVEELLCLYPSGGKEKRVLLVGLGREEKLSVESLRRSYGRAMSFLKERADHINFVLPITKHLSSAEVTEGAAEGALLASYGFDRNKTKKEKTPSSLTLIGGDQKALQRSLIVCRGVCTARDLVIENADVVTPAYLVQTATEMAAKHKQLKVTALDLKAVQKEKLSLLEAVNRGGSVEPALIFLEYKGAPESKELTALVGKGVTYDTGGLSLKPTSGMLTMRDDMSGAAAVLGTLETIAELQLPINVLGVVVSTENVIGSKSYKIGDVYKSHAGVTVEVTNTDAEGRLVLADALSYTQAKYTPSRIVDIATLTGGVSIAYGEEASGLMSNDDELASKLTVAGERVYERLCQMPLYEEYEALLQSSYADIKNSGIRQATSIQGGIFLKRFIREGMSWAHIDIGATAFPEKLKSYQPVRASGVGVRLFTKFLENLCS